MKRGNLNHAYMSHIEFHNKPGLSMCIVLKQEAEGWSIYVASPTVMLRCSLMTLTTDSDVDGITAVTMCGLAPVNT